MPKNNYHTIGFVRETTNTCKVCGVIFSGNAQKRMELHLKLKHGMKSNCEYTITYGTLNYG